MEGSCSCSSARKSKAKNQIAEETRIDQMNADYILLLNLSDLL